MARCGMLPWIGEACDLNGMIMSAAMGDWEGAATSAASMIPWAGWAAGGKKMQDLVRQERKLKEEKKKKDREDQECKTDNRFIPGTRVLLADGGSRPIEKLAVGDRVLATDPTGGFTAAKPVTATITGEGDKKLVDITIDTNGDRGDDTATITATHNHPFWVPALSEWVDAERLAPPSNGSAPAPALTFRSPRSGTTPPTPASTTSPSPTSTRTMCSRAVNLYSFTMMIVRSTRTMDITIPTVAKSPTGPISRSHPPMRKNNSKTPS